MNGKLWESGTGEVQLTRCRRLVPGVADRVPIENGGIIHNNNIIFEIGSYYELKKNFSGAINDLGSVTIVPGLVNAHCHLNLSKLYGLTVQGRGFVDWLLSLIENDYRHIDFTAVKKAAEDAKKYGICCFGDIMPDNNTKTSDILTELGIYHICFCEAFGFFSLDYAAGLPFCKETGCDYRKADYDVYGAVAGAGHGLHTTGSAVLQAVKIRDSQAKLPFSIHLAEHEDETGILMGEKNDFYRLLDAKGFFGSGYHPPMKTPVEYGRDIGILDSATIAVHCVQVTDNDIDILAGTGTNVCLCPRSNDFIGVGRAPWEKIMDAGICVSVATDSMASNYDLNLWNELLYFLERVQINLSLSGAVSLITSNPAKALLMDKKLGTLEKGKIWKYAVMPMEIVNFFRRL